MRRSPLLLISLSLLPLLGGCLAAAAAAGAAFGYVKYRENEATRDFEKSPPEVWPAALGALEARGYPLPGGTPRELEDDADSAEVEGEDYWLRVEEHPGDFTRVRVRIGTFETDEHKRKAGLVLESVAERL